MCYSGAVVLSACIYLSVLWNFPELSGKTTVALRSGLGLKVQGLGFMVWGLLFRVGKVEILNAI